MLEERPELVLVYGDTNSTLAATRAAGAAGVQVAHVEAGLRSGDLTMPEEHNRIDVDATRRCSSARTSDHAGAGREDVAGETWSSET